MFIGFALLLLLSLTYVVCFFIDCRQPPLNAKPGSYAGHVDVFEVTCKPEGNYSKKAFVVHWNDPKGMIFWVL